MATPKIIGQNLKASKLASDYISDGAFALTPVYDASQFSGDMIAASLFEFSGSDASHQVFAQLALAYRQKKNMVIAIDADHHDIDYIDSAKTQLLLNKDGSFSIYNPDFEKLAQGEVADVSIRFLQPATSNSPTFVINTTQLTVTGTNEAPLVAAPLDSATTEDQAGYVIDLLQGATDIDHNAVLSAASVAEASDNTKGWTLEGNKIVVDPSAYGYLNDGESKQLNFTYQVTDEHGASAAQSLTIDIEGITDAPTIEVTTLAGADANELILHVVSTQAASEQVKLAFLNLPTGAKVYDGGTNVTKGIANFFAGDYDGTHDFKVVFDGDQDLATSIEVAVTGIHPAHDAYPYKELVNTQSVEVNYDVNETTPQSITFSNTDQNMWGDFGSPVIEWHEYLPVLGNDFMQWGNGAWYTADEGIQRWQSGTVTLADVSFSSDAIVADALAGLKLAKDSAKSIYDAASTAYSEAVAIRKVLLDLASTVNIENIYNDAKGGFNAVVGKIEDLAKLLSGAIETLADAVGLGDEYRDLKSAFESAEANFNKLVYSSTELLNQAGNLISGISTDLSKLAGVNGIALPATNTPDAWLTLVNKLFSEIDAKVQGSAAFLYNAAVSAYDTAYSAVSSLDFSTDLKVDAEISGYAGVLVDFRLDGGSVNTDVQYTFSSKTQYNQTTDMLAITPTLVNVTDGTEVAFSTASPNVSITAKLLYDVAAAMDVYVNGKLAVGGLGFDLGDGVHFTPVFTTSGSNMQFEIIDKSLPILDANGAFNLDNLKFTMSDEIVPYSALFGGQDTEAGDTSATTGSEVTLFDFDSSTGDLSIPFYSTNVNELVSDKLSDLISGKTEGMIEAIELALPYIATEGSYVSQDDLLSGYLSSPEYILNKLIDPSYNPTDQSFGQTINDYYYDETLKTVNIDQVTSIFENASIKLGAEVAALLDLEYLNARGYTNLTTYLQGADIAAIVKDVSANFARNAFELFKETLDGKYTTDAFVIVDMTQGESDALFHFNTFNFNSDDLITDPTNPDHWTNPLVSYQDPDVTEDTAAFGLYVSAGESEPIYKVTLDVDEMVAFVLRKVIYAVTGIDLPDNVSPFKMGASLDDILSLAEVDDATRTEVKKYIDVGMTVDKMDYDVTSSIDFSQDFTLTVDDMSYVLTFTEGEAPVTMGFLASEADKIVIADASQYDVNHDGSIDYDLQIVPTAMFSNDTELGYNYGLSLDFLTAALTAKIGLPLKDLLGIAVLPNLSYDLLDYNIGPVLAIDAEINGLDIDVYEARFDMAIGEVTLEDNGVNIALVGAPVLAEAVA